MDSRYSNQNYPSSNRGYSGNSGYPKKKKKKKKYRLRIQPRFYFLLAIFVVVIALMIVAVKALTASDSGEPQAAESTKKSGGFIAELFKTPTPSPTRPTSPEPRFWPFSRGSRRMGWWPARSGATTPAARWPAPGSSARPGRAAPWNARAGATRDHRPVAARPFCC